MNASINDSLSKSYYETLANLKAEKSKNEKLEEEVRRITDQAHSNETKHNIEMQQLQRESDQLREENTRLLNEKQDMENKMSRMQEDIRGDLLEFQSRSLTEHTQSEQNLKKEIEQMNTKIDQLRSVLKQKVSDLRTQTQLNKEASQKIEQLEKDLNNTKTSLKKQEKRNTDLNDTITKGEKEIKTVPLDVYLDDIKELENSLQLALNKTKENNKQQTLEAKVTTKAKDAKDS